MDAKHTFTAYAQIKQAIPGAELSNTEVYEMTDSEKLALFKGFINADSSKRAAVEIRSIICDLIAELDDNEALAYLRETAAGNYEQAQIYIVDALFKCFEDQIQDAIDDNLRESKAEVLSHVSAYQAKREQGLIITDEV